MDIPTFKFNEKTRQHECNDPNLFIKTAGSSPSGDLFKLFWDGYEMLFRARCEFKTKTDSEYDEEVTWLITSVAATDNDGNQFGYQNALQMFQASESMKSFLENYDFSHGRSKMKILNVHFSEQVKKMFTDVLRKESRS